MRTLTAFITMIASTSSLAGAALAQPQSRLNDLDFIKAARCAGLAEGTDTAKSLRAYVSQQSRGRNDVAQARADQATRDATAQIHAATGERLQRLTAERDACVASAKSE